MDTRTLARVNINAVLRTLEQLPALDARTAALAAGPRRVVQFAAPRVASARLVVGGGAIGWHHGAGPADISLAFPTAGLVNKMFAGTGNPIPVRGFRDLGFLKGPFTEITERLSHYLRPSPELCADPAYAQANATLSLHLALYALAEIGNSDPAGRATAARMKDGAVVVAVTGGPALTLRVKDHRLSVTEGADPGRRSYMLFRDLDTAGEVLRGDLAAYTAIGRQQIELGGYVPLLDEMNKLLGLVPRYLA